MPAYRVQIGDKSFPVTAKNQAAALRAASKNIATVEPLGAAAAMQFGRDGVEMIYADDQDEPEAAKETLFDAEGVVTAADVRGILNPSQDAPEPEPETNKPKGK